MEFQQHHGRLHRAGRLHANALLFPVVGAGREEHGVHLGPLAVLVVQVEVHAVGMALAGVEVAPARGRSVEDDLLGSGDFLGLAEGAHHDGLGSRSGSARRTAPRPGG